MALLARPAALAALALALAPALAPADTTNIVFPVAGPVVSWKDDYGTVSNGTRQAGNAIGVAAGTPVVATASGEVRLLWRGSGGWSIALTTPTGDRFVYLHLGRDGNRRSAYAAGLQDGQRVKAGRSWAGAASPAMRQPGSPSSASSTSREAARPSIPTSCWRARAACRERGVHRRSRSASCG